MADYKPVYDRVSEMLGRELNPDEAAIEREMSADDPNVQASAVVSRIADAQREARAQPRQDTTPAAVTDRLNTPSPTPPPEKATTTPPAAAPSALDRATEMESRARKDVEAARALGAPPAVPASIKQPPEREEHIDLQLPSGEQLKAVTPAQAHQANTNEMVKTLNGLAEDYKAESNDLKRKQLWEGIIQGVGMIAAGVYGMQRGLAMSGLQPQSSDWLALHRDAREDYQKRVDSEMQKYHATQATALSATEDMNKRNQLRDRDWQMNRELYHTGLESWNAQRQSSEINVSGDMKLADLNLQLDAAKVRNERLAAMQERAGNAAESKEAKEAAGVLEKFKQTAVKVADPKTPSAKRDAGAAVLQTYNQRYYELTHKEIMPSDKIMHTNWYTFGLGKPHADAQAITEGLEEFAQTGGAPREGTPPATGFPRTVTNGTNSATVTNEAEAKAAAAKGYK